MKVVRVILADDHNLVRTGIKMLVDSLPGVEVVAEAADGYETLALVATHLPDVVLLDIGMPRLNGLETAARISKDYPAIRILMLSVHTTEEYVLRALRVGAAGYLLKDADQSELELALKAVTSGETYLSPGVSRHVIDQYLQTVSGASRPLDELTPRQRQILQLIAEGQTTKQIAQTLNLSVKTVDSHRTAMMDRLNLHDIAGLVRFAVRMGLVTSE
ncbi:MAG: response regulator transcription factor [Anaerolineae bacterium]